MSFNQSRLEKSEGQSRKPGRSGSSACQRSFSGGVGKGGGRTARPPSPSISSSSSLSTNKSINKSINGPGGYSRVGPISSNSEPNAAITAKHVAQNGIHLQSHSHGVSDASVSVSARPMDSSMPRSSRSVPKAPSHPSTSAVSDSTVPVTPSKGDASRAFPLQFGTISPGFMNGMQIPARTSSAPPNLDEQKRDQAHHNSFRAVPTLPIPSAPKQQQQLKKDVISINQSNAASSQPPLWTKRDVNVPTPVASASTAQKSSVLPMTGVSMPRPFQQPPVPMQFGGPSPQIQSQGITAPPLQMPMPLPVGNSAQVQQQVFIPTLQSHALLPQGMMHRGQNLGFSPQMVHQLVPQISNPGIGILPQFAQQQGGNFGSSRIPVKITDPETHKEVRLDKRTDSHLDVSSSGTRSHPNVPNQSQPIPSFSSAHTINYYPVQPNSYNSPPVFFQTPTSLPLTGSQMTHSSSASRYNYPIGQAGQTVSFMNPSAVNPLPVSKAGPSMHNMSESVNLECSHDGCAVSISAPAASGQVTVKPAVGSEKIGISSVVLSSSAGKSSDFLRQNGKYNSHHHQKESEMATESTLPQPSSVSEPLEAVPLPGTVKNSNPAPPAISMHTLTASASSVLVGPAEVSASVVTNTESRRKESVKRLDSFKDQQKKLSRREPQHSQKQHQADPLDTSVSSRTSSLKVSQDSISFELDGENLLKNHENVLAPSEAIGSVASAPCLASPSSEHSTSSGRASETEEGKAKSTTSETSGVFLVTTTEDVLASSSASSEKLSGVLVGEGGPCELAGSSGLEGMATSENLDIGAQMERDASLLEVGARRDISGTAEHSKAEMTDVSALDCSNFQVHKGSAVSESIECSKQTEVVSDLKTEVGNMQEMTVNELSCAETEQLNTNAKALGSSLEADRTTDNLTSTFSGCIDAEAYASTRNSYADAHEDTGSSVDAFKVRSGISKPDQGAAETGSGVAYVETDPLLHSVSSSNTQKLEGRSTKGTNSGPAVTSSLGSKDRISLEQNRVKGTSGKKKKKKEILLKADAAGISSDLYMAYKGPEEKPQTTIAPETVIGTSNVKADDMENNVVANEDDSQSKEELDDWEDAAEVSTPKLKVSENGEQLHGARKHDDEYGNGVSVKKYSRDFLLTIQAQCLNLPIDFEIQPETRVALMSCQDATLHLRDSYASSGRSIDWPAGGSRLDRRGSSVGDDEKWSKVPSLSASGRDPCLEVGYGGAVTNFRPGHGSNQGVLWNPWGQSSGQYPSGILPGPVQSLAPPGGMPRADADRWLRATDIQKGLIPSPQTPLQVMHKAEKKYAVGKVSDEEDAKQRQLKAILNKLTPQNFEKLFEQVKAVNIDNAGTLTGVISQIFDKALMEPTFCEMYANFCCHLADELPHFSEDNEKITFRRLLLNKCQEEFERGEREQAEANRAEEDGEVQQSEEEREEKKLKARRRMLGNIRLIGELYKKRMLTERIMHECIKKLLGQYENPDEEDVEALCKLMSTIGEMIDHPKAKEHMDAYFDMMQKLSKNQKLSSRVRFMLRDAIDLRKNKWQQRRKVEGPKKIEEVHRDAAQERQLQVGRSSRGSNITSVARRGPPMDYVSRGSMSLSSPGSQQGALHGLPTSFRSGYMSTQDARLEDRHFESRTLSIPLLQRSVDDDSITLGPQGGLARGMSIRGQPSMSSVPLADVSFSNGEPRRMISAPNGCSSTSDRTLHNSREEFVPRYSADRFAATPAYDQSNSLERNISFGNRDSRNSGRPFDRSMATSPSTSHVQGPSARAHLVPSEPTMSVDRLRDLSIAAIREFYSARNEEEVRLCIKDLKCPDFYPDMVMLWVMDSFDRKNDIDRDLLAKLLVDLCTSRDSLLSKVQLIKGFESVLATLEDAVTDSPKAAEYLGRILGKVITENAISLREIGRLIHEGGEEPGCLLQSGLASDVLVSILELIRRERGDSVLNEMRMGSNLQLEDFRPADPIKSRKLDAFMCSE